MCRNGELQCISWMKPSREILVTMYYVIDLVSLCLKSTSKVSYAVHFESAAVIKGVTIVSYASEKLTYHKEALAIMGSIVALGDGVMDVVEHAIPYLDEPDNIALSESVLAPKPPPRPEPEPIPNPFGNVEVINGDAYWVLGDYKRKL